MRLRFSKIENRDLDMPPDIQRHAHSHAGNTQSVTAVLSDNES